MTITGRITLAAAAAILLTALILAVAVDISIRKSLTRSELARQQALAERMAADLNAQVYGAREDAAALVNAVPAAQLLDEQRRGAPSAATRAEILRTFNAVMAAKPRYMQMRLIGRAQAGREVIRLERSGPTGAIRTVAEADLQPKGDRPYFAKTMALAPGEIYVSPMELNQEHGRVQTPHMPVLRTAAPVFAPDGQAIGILIVNVDMRDALERLHDRAGTSTVYLVNAEGGYLVHPDPAREFTAQTPGARRLGDDFPALAAVPSTRTPLSEEIVALGQGMVVAVAPVSLGGGPRAVVVTMTPSSRAAATQGARLAIIIAAAIAVLIGILAAYLLARSISRPISQITTAARGLMHAEALDLPARRGGEVGVLADTLEDMHAIIRDRNAARAREERRLRQVIDASPSAMLMVDSGGLIHLANAQAETLFGYPRAELVGQKIEMLVPETSRGQHPALVRSFFAHPEARAMGAGRELFALRQDGVEVPVEIGLNPIQMREGLFTLASVLDITERKRHQDELHRSNTELEQFAYIASHDLQEPLRMVASYTELLADRYRGRLDERADKYIHYASDGARRMQQLITDLLAYSRVGSQGKAMTPVASREVITAVAELFAPQLQDLGGAIQAPPDPPLVLADEGQLRQLFQNLFSNAIKFRSAEPPHIEVEARQERDGWVFSVRDNGIGMDAHHADRIFDMFQRLHERGKYDGSGIGLAIAKRIVERHGGRIWMTSEPGKGTTFFFTLQSAA